MVKEDTGMDNMTALVSAFARAYHYINNDIRVFSDPFAEKMLTDEEYTAISQNMSRGISFFAPEFHGPRKKLCGTLLTISLHHLFWPAVRFVSVQSGMQ